MSITARVSLKAQSWAQCPILWNALYDELLQISLPGGVKIVGFADDVVFMVIGAGSLLCG